MLRNTTHCYGFVAITLHWLMAVMVAGLFVLGDFMTRLDYYHPWYYAAPDWHRGVGVMAAMLLLLRWWWRLANPLPAIAGPRWERLAALLVHRLFYLLMTVVTLSGYLITTAKGQGIDVFGLFSVPATLHGAKSQADIAGEIHRLSAWALMGLAPLHGLAALKHHFIDRDATLRRMLVPGCSHNPDFTEEESP